MALNQKFTALRKFFARQRDIGPAYLFGSTARGERGPLSDIDLALYFKESISPGALARRKMQLIYDITGVLKTDRIDLAIINQAPLLLKYQIIATGLVLKDDPQRVSLEGRILCDYLDQKYYLDRYTKIFLRNAARKGLL